MLRPLRRGLDRWTTPLSDVLALLKEIRGELKKIDESISKVDSLRHFIESRLGKVVGALVRASERGAPRPLLYRADKRIEEQVDVRSLTAYTCYLMPMLLWQVPLEPVVGDLRYEVPSIEKDAVLVYWSEKVMDVIEKREALKHVEKFVEGEETPEQKELLEALSKFLIEWHSSSPLTGSSTRGLG